MYYMGGKRRIGKKIAERIITEDAPRRIVEPFLGGGGFLLKLLESGYNGEIIAGDYNPDITAFFKALRLGWLPPASLISKEEWEVVMKGSDFHSTALRGFTYFASMYRGAPKARYTPLAYQQNGTTNWDKQWKQAKALSEAMMNSDASITFIGGDYQGYEEWLSTRTVVYCDPPYADTSGYRVEFDHETFWKVAREWGSRPGVSVYVSEYTAPENWKSVWSTELTKPQTHGQQESKKGTENLFQLAA